MKASLALAVAMLGFTCGLIWAIARAVQTGEARGPGKRSRAVDPFGFWTSLILQGVVAVGFGLMSLLIVASEIFGDKPVPDN